MSNYENMKSDFPYFYEINSIVHSYPKHRHNYVEISYIISGEGYEVLNGTRHDLRPGKMTLLLPHQVHALYSQGVKPLKVYNLCIGLEVFFGRSQNGQLYRDILFSDSDKVQPYVYFDNEQTVKDIFSQLYEEFSKESLWREDMFRVLVTELLIFFDRNRKSISTEPQEVLRNSAQGSVWEVIYYLYNNYQSDLSLAILANEFGMSIQHISTSIKKLVGESFGDFVNGLRLNHADNLIRSTEMLLTDVAFEVGYQSYATFSRVFRLHFGHSPSMHRRLKDL